MYPKTAAWVAALVAVMFCCALAFALGGDHPKGQPPPISPDWPEGLKELVNSEGYLGGYFVNANDFFQFEGDSHTFNNFLQRYAQLKDTPLILVLHPGQGMTKRPWKEHTSVPFDWSLNALRRGWHPDAPEAKPGEKGQYVVTVNLWLGGHIGLDDLDVPLNIEVRSGGKVERFIAEHQAKRAAAEKKTE